MSSLPSWYIRDSDILILVVGQTGTGKSQFINTATGTNVMEVNHGLVTCSDLRVQYTICTHPAHTHNSEPPFRIVLVDTPGLNGTLTEDFDIVQHIAHWINTRCNKDMDFAILYLVESQQRYLPLLDYLCNNNAIRDITLAVGTKFNGTDAGEPSRDEDHNGTYDSAWNIIDYIRDHRCAARASEVKEFFDQFRPRERKIIKFWRHISSLF